MMYIIKLKLKLMKSKGVLKLSEKYNMFSQSKEFANLEAEKNLQKTNIDVENIVVPGVKKETKKQISLMFTPSQKEKVRRLSKSRGMSISEFLGKIIDQIEE